MARKKIVFVIVEGPSDEDALGLAFTNYYKQFNNTIHVDVMHCDITTEKGVTPQNIREKITQRLKYYAGNNSYKATDFVQIFHIIDTDGAFVPADAVVEDTTAGSVIYTSQCIQCPNKQNILNRNAQKTAVVNAMLSLKKIWGSIPYQVLYMSCNLDHVLYDVQNGSPEDKRRNSLAFMKKYKCDLQGFVSFIRSSTFSVPGDYQETWDYIRQDRHSLERHTNLGLCFEKDSEA